MKLSHLKAIIREKSMKFTENELWDIIDEELEKSEEEMDAQFVEKCLNALYENKNKPS